MKFGILTFHWATNYGAVLQTYALQSFLENEGHEVVVINYKPSKYNDSILNIIYSRRFLHPSHLIEEIRKEKSLSHFRNQHLHQTTRILKIESICNVTNDLDVIISGSDQVMNPYFLLSGEGKNTLTPTYFLGFPYDGKRIGYALSFGCTVYPEKAKKIASNYIKKFNALSVREKTGIDILHSIGNTKAIIVPDPTLLQPKSFYHKLISINNTSRLYIYCFFIRNKKQRRKDIMPILAFKNIQWNNDDGDYSMQGWLKKIQNSKYVITDSFHCVVMCLKFHTPFCVITEEEGNIGMNDRFYTLLSNLGLEESIVYKKNINKDILNMRPNWPLIDQKLEDLAEVGYNYLRKTII